MPNKLDSLIHTGHHGLNVPHMEPDGHMPWQAELVQLEQGCRLIETADTDRMGTRHAEHRCRQAQA